ncbi:hypothetical protein [Marichromatium bheemlicum]|uniref:DUF3887 domain-containing protein n=1 Tax=Marichromatium bheemlicum TaxID=365339 RepID=A0ABX1I3L9_9GAMM|nr:hypothetical protein [Marichromatium bheemlicum]NKN32075.1 hypothetical protein [Marichromatium bheemlicum]
MRHTSPLYVALLALGLPLSVSATEDPVIEQLEAAATAYEENSLRGAIGHLEAAIAEIQEQIGANLLKLLPEPLDGWRADEAVAESGGMASMITGTHLSRRYTREDGAEITLNLMADSPMMPMLTMALSMPMMMQGNPDLKPYALAGHRGMVEHAADSEDYEITLMVGARLVIQAQGSGLDDKGALEAYLERLDLDAIEAALGD